MPHGLQRFQQAQSLHFLTFSCYHRLPYLDTPETKTDVLRILEQTRSRHQARIYAYVLMPNHVHLLINEPPEIILAQWLKSFKQAVSRVYKRDRKQFWQSRYYDANVHGQDEVWEVVQYIHRNPIKRELVEKPEEYRWSSFHDYATGEPGLVEIESEWTAFKRDRESGVDPLITMRP